jgi:hypothetical protein
MIVFRRTHPVYALLVAAVMVVAGCAPPRVSNTPAPQVVVTAAASATLALPTSTPFFFPTPPPSPTPFCAGAPRRRLILQERGQVLPDDPRPVNLRSDPGTDNDVLAQIPVKALFFVLDGPVCEGEYTWFKVRYRGREGWLAEGDLTSYYVEPYFPG